MTFTGETTAPANARAAKAPHAPLPGHPLHPGFPKERTWTAAPRLNLRGSNRVNGVPGAVQVRIEASKAGNVLHFGAGTI